MSHAEETATALAVEFEGFRREAYQDVVGVWTVGYGTTRLAGRPVVRGDALEEVEARRLLTDRLAAEVRAIRAVVRGSTTDNQIAAFADLAYNVGRAGVLGSTALRKHNAGDRRGAADAFLLWCKAGGQTVPGLLRRRQAEATLYLTP